MIVGKVTSGFESMIGPGDMSSEVRGRLGCVVVFDEAEDYGICPCCRDDVRIDDPEGCVYVEDEL